MDSKITIIGVDGGASKVSAHIIQLKKNSFSLSPLNSIKEYKNYQDFRNSFKPVDLRTQLLQVSENSIAVNDEEIKHAKAYYSAFSDAINDVCTSTNPKKVLVGIGMPGIKSDDRRGIIAMANGPRMPKFAEEIEKRLSNMGITLVRPISRLGSDADYCGIGEEFAEKGTFKGFDNVYYLGGGTGTADALKLRGELTALDNCKDWIAKTWELRSDDGRSMESFCSANGIQSIYSEICNISQDSLNRDSIFINQILDRAIGGEIQAIQTWEIVTEKIALLLFERISTIFSGWHNTLSFIDPNRMPLNANHSYRGILLNRIVIGQRLGELFRRNSAQSIIVQPILDNLFKKINSNNSLPESAKSHYLLNNNFNKEIFIISKLREAPALGAGIDAWNTYATN